jgi:hypothetical protein
VFGERLAPVEGGVCRSGEGFLYGLVDEHCASGDVSGGEDMRCAGALRGVHADVSAAVGVDAGGGQLQRRGVCGPSDRDNRYLRGDALRATLVGVRHADAARCGLEPLDRAGGLEDGDAIGTERGGDRVRDVGVFARQYAGCCFEEVYVRAERVED